MLVHLNVRVSVCSIRDWPGCTKFIVSCLVFYLEDSQGRQYVVVVVVRYEFSIFRVVLPNSLELVFEARWSLLSFFALWQ